MPTPEIDELTRLYRELTGLHNGMDDLDGEIKTACQNDPKVCAHLTAVYFAIESLQGAIKEYKKKTA